MGVPPLEKQSVDRVTDGDDGIETDSEALPKLQRLGLSLAAATGGASCLVTVVLVVSVLCCSAASLVLLIFVLEETLGNLGVP